MTVAMRRLQEGSLTTAVLAPALDHARPQAVHGPLRRAGQVIGDLFMAAGVGLIIPVAILAVGIPVALCVRFLLWIAGML